MPLNPGTRLGPYEVISAIGAGGMGEVYRATDTRLKRHVAIKVLPPALAADADRLARFQREAELLASLNHPNIAGLHGVEEGGGVSALVMELVEGEDLSKRILRGPIPIDEALPIARQIAEALEAAHEQGIIHRDLKPANIKVRSDGTAKVLDFGLAKAMERAAGSSPNGSQSPTVTTPAMTEAGKIMGTLAYMSPEQARGRPVDRRTDIWAFGCVLYEMLTGVPAFSRQTVTDTLSAITRDEPDWNVHPDTPPHVNRLLRRCLDKDPRTRLRDVGEARIALAGSNLVDSAPDHGESPPIPRARLGASMWAVALLLALAASALTWWIASRRPPADGQVVRSVITLPSADSLELRSGSLFAMSPDGARLVYSARREGRLGLHVRVLDQFQSQPLEGTEGATHPFFSPDSRWVGFFANGTLKKVALEGGTPTVVCDTPIGHGASWAPDNTIVFARPGSGLMRVSANGGTPQPATTLSADRREMGHDWPQVLPGGRFVLFTILLKGDLGAGFGVAPLEGGGSTRLIAATRALDPTSATLLPPGDLVQARYVSSGHLVYGQIGGIWGLPFDLQELEAQGSPIQLIENVFEGPNSGAIAFAIGGADALAYVPAATERSLVSVDRRGRASSISPMRGPFRFLRLSPDGRRLAVCIDSRGGPTSIWVFDLARGTPTRLTSAGHTLLPVWRPDGQQIAYTNGGELQVHSADGAGAPRAVLSRPGGQSPYSWTPDGRTLIFTEQAPDSGLDVWSVTLPDGVATPVLVTSDNESLPSLSSDGRWLAYVSDESGRAEVYVRALRQPGARVQVSLDGGTEPVWSQRGDELFFRRVNEYYAAPIRSGRSFEADRPQYLFTYGLPYVSSEIASYDVTPDGEHFVMVDSDPESSPTHFRLVTNWLDELSNRIRPADRP